MIEVSNDNNFFPFKCEQKVNDPKIILFQGNLTKEWTKSQKNKLTKILQNLVFTLSSEGVFS